MLDPGVRRVRRVEMNLDIIDRQAKTIEMEFFPNVKLTVNWTSVTPGQPASVWTGKVAGTPGGDAFMTVSGKIVTANFNRGNGMIYQIRTAADGSWWVREIDQKEFPQESQPVIPNPK